MAWLEPVTQLLNVSVQGALGIRGHGDAWAQDPVTSRTGRSGCYASQGGFHVFHYSCSLHRPRSSN